MKAYRRTMANLAAPKLAIFAQSGSITNYQAFRYGFTSCLMDDGYFTYTNSASEYRGVPWFDEFNANLGAAVSPPSTSAWQQGVFRRDFQNGIALVNPKGNGQKTVTLDGEYVLIRGTQAPTVNTGARVRQVTLRDRDGLILMRVNPVRRPAAPGGVQIETASN